MKTLKKTLAFLLAMSLILCLSATALAAEETGSITITDALEGETYSAYRIFDLESYNAEDGKYAYKTNEKWASFFDSGASKDYFTVDEQGYVTWIKGADPAAFATLAKEYAKEHNIDPERTAECAPNNGGTFAFANLPLGYYLVDTSLGSLCSLDTTNPHMTVKDKNEKPEIDKTVLEDSTGRYGKENDADFNQIVTFQAIINAKPGAPNYVMHDKMSEGLTFGSVIDITLNGTVVNPVNNYAVVTTDLCEDCDFHVAFTEQFLDTIKTDSTIVVTYTATVNDKAVIGGVGNPNDVMLSYGNEQETMWKQTRTYVWELNVFKYATEGDSAVETPLAGAQFILYKNVNGTYHYAQIKDGKMIGWTTERDKASTLETPENGFIFIDGLDNDVYYLEETKAPDGYNMLDGPIEVPFGKEGNVGEKVDNYEHTIKVLNQAGSQLPSTGGIGTTIFYTVGGLLMLVAVVLLVTKKRMSHTAD